MLALNPPGYTLVNQSPNLFEPPPAMKYRPPVRRRIFRSRQLLKRETQEKCKRFRGTIEKHAVNKIEKHADINPDVTTDNRWAI